MDSPYNIIAVLLIGGVLALWMKLDETNRTH